MDLTSTNFASYLPWVLNEIASSCFVAMDIEMSGIPLSIKQQGHRPLQKHYEDNKAAAEKYQILQIGLTICREDKEAGSYLLRPYNVFLNPCLDRNLNVNRDCTLMGWTMDFLVGHRFDVGMLFSNGVRYLSRQEEITTHQEAARRWAPSAPTEIERKLKDVEDIQYVRSVRLKIDKWLAGGKTRGAPLNIYLTPNNPGKGHHGLPNDTNATQKWAVHTMVKAEYPSLKSRGMADCIQIEQRNGGAMHYRQRMRESELRIRKHVGFRWIVEALVGGDLSALEPSLFQPLLGEVQDPSMEVEALMKRLMSRLKENRPILVGHNCFTDLIYFYQCFLGPLPDKVEDFIHLIHRAFPIIIDTKYVATQDCDAVSPSSSLEELTKTLAKIHTPKIAIEPTFSKYLHKRSAHEAGYDSMLTAIAFLKLSTHLEEGGKLPKGKRGRIEEMSLRLATALTSPVQDLFPSKGPIPRRSPVQDFFDLELDEEGPQVNKPVVQTSSLVLADTGSKEVDKKVEKKLLIPRLGSDFWHTYGNKLRVFAAHERMVFLGPTEDPVDVIKKTELNDVNGVNGEAKENEVHEDKVMKTGVLICLD
ncbi:hypothetical protein F1880_002980 [Penicillium rolfsii]|nr:hypothetical protein F1880_002980 [Penicillium rolfsii]